MIVGVLLRGFFLLRFPMLLLLLLGNEKCIELLEAIFFFSFLFFLFLSLSVFFFLSISCERKDKDGRGHNNRRKQQLLCTKCSSPHFLVCLSFFFLEHFFLPLLFFIRRIFVFDSSTIFPPLAYI